ncbi:MAG: methionine adenosyltransferase [Candidatus Bipolaricaulota bacterium]|nr:MAG: methionine adenosyltransferase [Candidatus Bipolaricaulota bacterium]
MAVSMRTSESVTEGHPDKLADRISDAVLDAILAEDREGRVACETLLTTGLVLVGGEISTEGYVDVDSLVRRVVKDVGYDHAEYGFHHEDCSVLSAIKEQSENIAAAVSHSVEEREDASHDPFDVLGAGDQGIMYGYACGDTEEMMPLPIVLAHRLARGLTSLRKDGVLGYLRPDGKTQVTVRYDGRRPACVTSVVIAAQHDPGVEQETIEDDLTRLLVHPHVEDWLDEKTRVIINSSGLFVIGGPASDAGMTGRKIIVDTYGGYGSHGGGAFSGKDPTKVDRSGAYLARCAAKHLVTAGLATQAEVQVAYAIGQAAPLNVSVATSGTGTASDEKLSAAVRSTFDFRPGAIIDNLDLQRPIYEPFSAYGHFGRSEPDARWEVTDRIDDLRAAVG